MSARRWIGPVVGGVVTTGLGVAINVATELKSHLWAWGAVAVLTIAGIVVGVASEKLVRTRRQVAAAVNRGTTVSVAGDRNRVEVRVLGPGVVVAVGLVVIVGVVVGQATRAEVGTPGSVPTAGSSQPGVAPADALDVRIDHLRAFSEGWFAVFPRDKTAQAKEFIRTDPLPDDQSDMDVLFRRELEAGAYIAVGDGLPMRLVLTFRNKLNQKVVIRDLTVENKQDGKIVDGTAVFVEAGAANEPAAILHLDAAYPVARILNEELEEIGAYFANRTIEIDPGDMATLPIDLDAHAASHVFTLAITFDVDGKQYRQGIDNSGQPFRVTPLICASNTASAGLTYQAVHEMHYLPPDERRRLVEVDPRESIEWC